MFRKSFSKSLWLIAVLACSGLASTPVSAQTTAADAAIRYVQDNKQIFGLTGSDLNEMAVSSTSTSPQSGVTHIYLQQRYRGIDVWNGLFTVSVRADGTVVSAGSRFITNLSALAGGQNAKKAAADAARAAAEHVNLKPTKPFEVLARKGDPADTTMLTDGGISAKPIEARLTWVATEAAVRLAWVVEIEQPDGSHWWQALVDAETGSSLGQHDLVVHDSVIAIAAATARVDGPPTQSASFTPTDGALYNVFPLPFESPNDTGQQLVTNAAHPVASPFGWHDTDGAAGPEFTRTRGNNVHAYTDVDANNAADPGSDPDGGSTLTFNFPFDATQHPATYRPAAVTNLFYWNNIMHDVTYGYGFNEASGNFQVNNYGRGGLGNDDVRAEAQDGSGTNNANFATPVDGFRPRMQMFVWTHPFPNLLTVNPPAGIAGDYTASGAAFGPTFVATGPKTGTVQLVSDDSAAPTLGCNALVGFTPGNIALVQRGTCTFVVKIKNAQNAGAIAVIVGNNAAGAPITMGGTDATITIPSLMVSLADYNLILANLPVDATLHANPLTSINRDSDLDAGVITHEYGHGISNRLTGGPATVSCLNNAEQMGEGWSDWFALTLTARAGDTRTTPRGVGNYLVYEGRDGVGIRPTQYSTDMSVNPSTYAWVADTVNISQPHGIGYVWNTMLWEMYWNLVDKYGFNPDIYGAWNTGGNNLAMQLVIDGMKMQVCRPGFVDGRNAIVAADMALTGGANQCEIWHAFAKRGLGFSANQGSSLSRTDGVQAFDLPASCIPTLSLNDPAPTQYSDTISLNAKVSPAVFDGQPVTGSVEFFIGGVSVGSSAIASNGLATASVLNNRAAGSYNVTATFTPAGPAGVNSSSAGPKTLTVTKESAAASYAGDQFITTAGPNNDSAPVILAANLVQDADGYLGDLRLAKLVFDLFKSGNLGSTPDQTVGNVPVDASGKAMTTAILSADNWTVKVKVEPANGYWTSSTDTSTVTVAIGSTDRRVTGGGWVPDSASINGKGSFGFTVGPQKTGAPKGNSVFIFHGKDGYDYLVKSTSWQGGNLVFIGNPITNARFSGRATVQKMDRTTGAFVASFGNYSFTVEIRDGDLLNPRGADYYDITVLDNNGSLWHQVGGTNAPVEIGGGNVAIKGN